METFVVRLWRPSPDAETSDRDTDLHGTLLHPATGIEQPFQSEEELVTLLRSLR